jgi:hypothetical protein
MSEPLLESPGEQAATPAGPSAAVSSTFLFFLFCSRFGLLHGV